MWDWTPPKGGSPRLRAMPVWVRIWYAMPFVDRWAHAWMWRHGEWWVRPRGGPAG